MKNKKLLKAVFGGLMDAITFDESPKTVKIEYFSSKVKPIKITIDPVTGEVIETYYLDDLIKSGEVGMPEGYKGKV